jgi:RNA polymerase sigma factor (sigma-70 family)
VRAPSLTFLRTQSDQRLLRLARQGHERAFEAIVERYRKPLQRECRRVLSEARAEDAVQHAFMAAWTALRRGDEVRELRPWLYRIGFNSALNVARAPGFDYDELEESLRLTEAPQDELERRAVMRQTLAGIAALPDRQREALLRTAVEGTSQEEIARDLGLSNGAVRQLVHRARMSLRAAVTAVTPLPLVTWLASAGARPEPMAQRIAELAAGGAGVGATAAKVGTAVVVAGGAITGPVALDNQDARPRAAAPVEREARAGKTRDRAPAERPAVAAAAPLVAGTEPPASDPPAPRPSAPESPPPKAVDRAVAEPDRERTVRRERERDEPRTEVDEDVEDEERDGELDQDEDDEERPLARREQDGDDDEAEDDEEERQAPSVAPPPEQVEGEEPAEPETPEFRHEPAEEDEDDDDEESPDTD